jgi:hypothetical protein
MIIIAEQKINLCNFVQITKARKIYIILKKIEIFERIIILPKIRGYTLTKILEGRGYYSIHLPTPALCQCSFFRANHLTTIQNFQPSHRGTHAYGVRFEKFGLKNSIKHKIRGPP